MKLNINTIDFRGSIVDGPGVRTVLFTQGCNRRCKGCHNPSTWDKERGKWIEIKEIIKQLREECKNQKLTISGGEPLLQIEGILTLIKNLPDFNITLYTGYSIEEVPKELLNHLNYIKVGPYEEEKKTTIIPYIGSTNQKFINLKNQNNSNKKTKVQ